MNQEPDLRQIVMTAVNLSSAGSNDEALRLLESAGREGDTHPIVRNVAGDIYLKLGRKREALKAFDIAVRNAPSYPEAHCNRGVALQQLGRIEDAIGAFDRALKLRPQYAIAHFNRANALRDLRRPEDATRAYDRAIAIEPRLVEAWLNRGRVFLAEKDAQRALDDFDHTLRLRPGYLEAEMGRMEALRDLKRPGEALDMAERLLAKEPDNAQALAIRVLCLVDLRRKDEALAAADLLALKYPADAPSHIIRSAALRALNRYEEALSAAEAGARLAPRLADTQIAMASCHSSLGDYQGQLMALDRADRLGAVWRDTALERMIALDHLGRREEASAIERKLLAAAPDDPAILYNRGLHLLERGDYRQGFADYESRLAPGGGAASFNDEIAPRWRGEPLPGKRLLVYGEQGLGDNIQFARFLPRILESGAEISLEVMKPLRPLFRDIARGMTMVDGPGAARFDAQVSILSLAHVFGATIDSLPPPPYLRAEPERVEKWRGRIGREGFRIGIVWQGNSNFPGDRFRSAPLSAFAPVAALPDVRLISLQAIHGLDQLDRLPAGMRVETLGPETSDPANGLVEIAAVMANLDLYLSIDSGIGHLAGALGQPTFLLVRAQPEWRWPYGATQSAWYPATRIFRQRKLGDWEPEFAEVTAAVAEMIGARGG